MLGMNEILGEIKSLGSRRRIVAAPRTILLSVVLVFTGIVLFWHFRAPAFTGLANLWAVTDSIDVQADAAAILGGDLDIRPQAAAALYKRGLAPVVIISKSKLSEAQRMHLDKPDFEKAKTILIKLGVPEQSIAFFGSDLPNTHEEAIALRDWAEKNHAKKIIVPVDWSFTRRVQWAVTRELKKIGAEVAVQRLEPKDINSKNWWRSEQGIVTFQNEILKYIYYRLKY